MLSSFSFNEFLQTCILPLYALLAPKKGTEQNNRIIYSLDGFFVCLFVLIKVIHGRTFCLKYFEEDIFVFNVFCLYIVLDYYCQVFLNSLQHLICTKSPVEHCCP